MVSTEWNHNTAHRSVWFTSAVPVSRIYFKVFFLHLFLPRTQLSPLGVYQRLHFTRGKPRSAGRRHQCTGTSHKCLNEGIALFQSNSQSRDRNLTLIFHVVYHRSSAAGERPSILPWISKTWRWSVASSISVPTLTAWITAASRRTTSPTVARMQRSAASCMRGRHRSWESCPRANQMRATWRSWTCQLMRSVSDSEPQNQKIPT